MTTLIRSAAVAAERNLRVCIRFAGRHVEVASADVVEVLEELDRTRARLEQAQAAAMAALELPKVGQTVAPAPVGRVVGRG